jgi:hypothetical protein
MFMKLCCTKTHSMLYWCRLQSAFCYYLRLPSCFENALEVHGSQHLNTVDRITEYYLEESNKINGYSQLLFFSGLLAF